MEKLRRASFLLVSAPLALLLGLVPAGAANTIGSSDIIDQSIQKVDIGPNAVGTSEIVTNGVGSAEIAANAVGRSEIRKDGVGGDEIGLNAISGSELQANSVGMSEIASGAVGADEIATDAVGGPEILADAVGAGEIATDAVDTAEIKSGAVGAAELATGAVGAAAVADDIQIETARTYTGDGSFQLLASDLTLGATAGSDDGTDPDFLGATMGNVLGSNLTDDANYVGGVIGHYSVTGTNASSYPVGAVLGGISDGTTTADGAFVAYIDGDSATTTAGAAFKVMNNSSQAPSGFDFGLDLQDTAHDGYLDVNEDFYNSAPVRLVQDVVFLVNDAAPGTAGTGVAGPGSLYFDTTNKVLYINTGTKAAPTWTSVGSQT